MARKSKATKTGLFHARETRHMSRTKLVELSGVSKQQLSRLENGQIRLRLDHLKPFAKALGYTPEQMLLWGRYPGTGGHLESSDVLHEHARREPVGPPPEQVPELDIRAGMGGGGVVAGEMRKDGKHADALKPEGWLFPNSFVRDQLHTTASKLLVIDTFGDSMAPTIDSGDRVIVDTGHKSPSPDGLYAIRDKYDSIVVKRLQVMRSAGKNTRIKIISDNTRHANEEATLGELEIVGKVLCCLKMF
jgi:transcriptional regulator with XRE-family HTH domain